MDILQGLQKPFKKLRGRSAEIFMFAKKLRTKKIWDNLFFFIQKNTYRISFFKKQFYTLSSNEHVTLSSEYTSAPRECSKRKLNCAIHIVQSL